MLNELKLENVLFLDIETVPQSSSYEELSEPFKQLWDEKSVYFRTENQLASEVYNRAGIYAEFGKIVCISVGIITHSAEGNKLRLKSFSGDEEKEILSAFIEMINKSFNKSESLLCAHNGKEFDFPYLSRRILLNSLKLPKLLDTAGKRPWDVKHLDTLELWKFGDYKHYTSLKLLAAIFNIDSPKDDIEGKDVANVYWIEKDLPRIVRYCQKDVITIAQLILRYKGLELIKDENIEVVG